MSAGIPAFDAHPTAYAEAMREGLVRAHCLNVTDGDMADFLLDLGWYQYCYARLRVRGIDTAERRGTRGSAKRDAEAASKRARELLLQRHTLVRTVKGRKTFDRFVADVWIPAQRERAPEGVTTLQVPKGQHWWSFGELLVAEGHADPYLPG